MPTRKQRRRREKTFRHEYETVMLDAEGNEMPVDPDEQRAEREERERGRERIRPAGRGGTKKPPQKKRARPLREVQPPTWRRALRRGGIMGGLMFVLFVFVLKSGSTTARALTASVYAVMFIPLTYWADRLAYRTYLRRLESSGKQPAAKPRR